MILHSYVEQVMTMCWVQEGSGDIVMSLALVSAQYFEYHLEYFDDTSQLCRTGHDDVSRTKMRAHPLILFELFPLDGFRCKFVSAP